MKRKIYHLKIYQLELLQKMTIVLIALTALVDSLFWGRLIWPEAEVFWYNTVLNKSSEWGTSPFLWYFYSALPRGLGLSIFLIPVGLFLETRIRVLTMCALCFVFLYSFLPHKELRFIIYAYPLLNAASAAACHKIWKWRGKSAYTFILSLAVVFHIIVNICFTIFLLMIAGVNYPGGTAIARLHKLIPHDQTVNVHIDNLSAQTGVSRFTQINPNWIYNKTEHLSAGSPEMMEFTHLLVEAKSKYSSNLKPYLITHDILDVIDGFSHISFNYNLIPPIKIKTKPAIYILQRKEAVNNRRIRKIVKDQENMYAFSVMDTEDNINNKDLWNYSEQASSSEVGKNVPKDDNVVDSLLEYQYENHISKGTAGVKQNIKNIIQQMNKEEYVAPIKEQENTRSINSNELETPNKETFIRVEDNSIESNENRENVPFNVLKNVVESNEKENISFEDLSIGIITENDNSFDRNITVNYQGDESRDSEKSDQKSVDIASIATSDNKPNVNKPLKEDKYVPKIETIDNEETVNSSSPLSTFSN